MAEIRVASESDAEVIAWQRRAMFEDSGQLEAGEVPDLSPNFLEWVKPRIAAGEYLGWMAEQGGKIAGGAGVWIMPFPPHWMDAAPMRAYLLNFYVDPERRGQGLAGRLLEVCVGAARERGIKVVTLHASRMGKAIYEKYGFVGTNEMMLRL